MPLGQFCETAAEALAEWDKGEMPVMTISLGGLGPSYEQVIHILVFELLREHIYKGVPLDKLELPRRAAYLDPTGGQLGSATAFAQFVVKNGWKAFCVELLAKDQQRGIQVMKRFPQAPDEHYGIVADEE